MHHSSQICYIIDLSMSAIVDALERILPRKRLHIFGPDSLLMTSLPYYVLALLALGGLSNNNPQAFLFITIVYAGFPILDEIFSLDDRNPSEK